MKRFTKTLLSVAAVSAVSAAMAVSAMAEEVPMSASYVGDTVTLANVRATGASQTLLILKDSDTVTEDADGKNNIIQIDQRDDSLSFDSTKVGTLADGTYYVRVGGDGTLQSYTLTVSSTPARTKKTIIIGNVNTDTRIRSNDVTALQRYVAAGEATSETALVGTVYDKVDGTGTIIVGNVNTDTRIRSNDVTALQRYVAAGEATSETALVGNTVEVYVD